MAGNFKLKNHLMEFNGRSYFRGNAHNILLGSYGRKVRKVGIMNRLTPIDVLPMDQSATIKSTVITHDFLNVSGLNLNVGGKAKVVGEAKLELNISRLREGDLKIVGLRYSNAFLKKTINDSPQIIKYLKRFKSSRIVNEIWVVMEAEFANAIEAQGGVKAAYAKGIMEVNAEVGGQLKKQKSLSISAQSTFAYGMLAPVWDVKKKNLEQASEILDFKVDDMRKRLA